MRLGVLFSGGKDSTFAAYAAIRAGHHLSCLMTVHPVSPESPLLHHPGTNIVGLQARSMNLPWYSQKASSTTDIDESNALDQLVLEAIEKHHIEGVVHGGIRSRFQKRVFEDLCSRHSLDVVAPVWGRRTGYVQDLIGAGFRFVVTAVSAGGLDGSWLGRVVTRDDADRLDSLAVSHGISTDFEGGEAETLVVDCPLFDFGIMLCGCPVWDGYRGVLEISAATPLLELYT